MIQIRGLFGIDFDAVVVEVKTFFTFIQVCSGHTVSYIIVFPVELEQCVEKRLSKVLDEVRKFVTFF